MKTKDIKGKKKTAGKSRRLRPTWRTFREENKNQVRTVKPRTTLGTRL